MAYNLLQPIYAIVNGDMSQPSLTSQVVEIKNQDNVGIQLDWTGSPTGTFAIQISSNHKQQQQGQDTDVTVPGSWTTLPLNPAITATGSPDTAYVDLNQMSAMYVRVVYTMVSGSGTLNCVIVAKGV
jgi:hypothetical protein